MPIKNYSKTAQQIIEQFGGKDNVAYLNHCATRLRINPVDKGKCNLKAIEAIDGVLGLSDNGAEIQVIIGQSVEQLYPEVEKIVGQLGARASRRKKARRGLEPWWPTSCS